MNEIDDTLFRSMVWKNFFDMVKDGHLRSDDYILILEKNLFQEKSDAIIEENLGYAILAINKYTPKKFRPLCLAPIFSKCL